MTAADLRAALAEHGDIAAADLPGALARKREREEAEAETRAWMAVTFRREEARYAAERVRERLADRRAEARQRGGCEVCVGIDTGEPWVCAACGGIRP